VIRKGFIRRSSQFRPAICASIRREWVDAAGIQEEIGPMAYSGMGNFQLPAEQWGQQPFRPKMPRLDVYLSHPMSPIALGFIDFVQPASNKV
jgi:hypothetical protein